MKQDRASAFQPDNKKWCGRPPESLEVIVSLTASATAQTDLSAECVPDTALYETGIKVTDGQPSEVQLEQQGFHGEWNYKILPRLAWFIFLTSRSLLHRTVPTAMIYTMGSTEEAAEKYQYLSYCAKPDGSRKCCLEIQRRCFLTIRISLMTTAVMMLPGLWNLHGLPSGSSSFRKILKLPMHQDKGWSGKCRKYKKGADANVHAEN